MYVQINVITSTMTRIQPFSQSKMKSCGDYVISHHNKNACYGICVRQCVNTYIAQVYKNTYMRNVRSIQLGCVEAFGKLHGI